MSDTTYRHWTKQQALDALQLLINGQHRLHVPPQPTDADEVLGDVIDERDALRAALAALVDDDWVGWGADAYEERWQCFWCHAKSGEDTDMSADDPPQHTPECPVSVARGLLGLRRDEE